MTDRDRAPQNKSFRSVIPVVTLALAVDQASKWVMLNVVMVPPREIPVTPFFSLTLGFNQGASFGMLGDLMTGRPWAMIALTGSITAVIAVLALRSTGTLERTGLALVVGGALGNIIDRLRQGAVTDFLDVYWQNWHWPAFNVADIAITFGATCILAAALPSRRRKEPVLDQQ